LSLRVVGADLDCLPIEIFDELAEIVASALIRKSDPRIHEDGLAVAPLRRSATQNDGVWLPAKDSNLDKQIQRLLSCH
jgi:hypothetical protein